MSRPVAPPPASAADTMGMAKYSNAKSISSDAYFGDGGADAAAAQVRVIQQCVLRSRLLVNLFLSAAASCCGQEYSRAKRGCPNQVSPLQSQLRNFNGASAISSADYFNDGSTSEGADTADEFMNRLSLQVQQEMKHVSSVATAATRKVGNLLSNLNRY
jgi:hypothetical protein